MIKKKTSNILKQIIKFCFISSVLFSYSCKQKIKNKESLSILNDSPIFKPVVISGTTDEKKAFEYLNILDYSNFFGSKHLNQEEKKSADSLFITLKSIKEPRIMEVMLFGDNLYRTRFFVTPEDSIHIEIKNNKIRFKGKLSTHYNFYLELDSLDSQWATINYDGNIKEYKNKCDKLYKSRKAFFDTYIKTHKGVSNDFINFVQGELKFEYLYNLISPRSIKSEYSNASINNLDGLFSVLENESNMLEGNFLNLENYFDNINIEDFNRPELINNDFFKRSLVKYIRHYFVQHEYLNYTKETFNAELNFIKENLNGEIAKYATGRLIYDYYNKGFGQDESNFNLLKNVISDYKKLSLNPTYREVVNNIEEELNLFNSIIPKNLRNERLLTIKGDTIIFADIINSAKGKTKIIDFWASWCTPCISDIKHSKKIKEKLTLSNNID